MIVGLCGLYASGKNKVAKVFEEDGYLHIDVDKIGHTLLDDKKEELIYLFGNTILDDTNNINRKKLGDIVFNDQISLNNLNNLLHTEMKKIVIKIIELNKNKNKNILINAAILYKMKLDELCDITIIVISKISDMIIRGQKRDGFSSEKIKRIIKNQLPIKNENNYSDYIIRNFGDANHLILEVKELLKKIKQGGLNA